MGEVTITAEEYKVLVLKAYKYDKLREKAVNSSFVSDCEAIIFELTEEELKSIEERGKQKYETL